MKNILLLPLLFLFSCATTQGLSENRIITTAVSGQWKKELTYDAFDGRITQSYVISDDGKAMLVFTTNGNHHLFRYANGDSYICTYGSLNMDMIADGERKIIGAFPVANNQGLGFDFNKNKDREIEWLYGGTENRMYTAIRYLTGKKNLIIRTTDTCGTQITRRFDISGSFHLKISTSKSRSGMGF